MTAAAKLRFAGPWIVIAIGIGLTSAIGQTQPKPGAKHPVPPKTTVNPGTQTSAQPKSTANSGTKSSTQSKYQVKPGNLISRAEMEHMQQLGLELALNQNQFTQIVNIVNESHVSENAVDADTQLTPAEKQKRLTSIQRRKNGLIDSLLMPEQRTKLKQIMRGN